MKSSRRSGLAAPPALAHVVIASYGEVSPAMRFGVDVVVVLMLMLSK
jgi:hypothetical protein